MSEIYVSTARKRVRIAFKQQGVTVEARPVAVLLSQPKLRVVTVGRQGLPGASAQNNLFVQSTPSDEWIVNHNLGFRPKTEVLTVGGMVMGAEVIHQSINQFRVYLKTPMAGQVIY